MKGISLLIPTYNRPQFLRRSLISVLNQTRLPDEIIISDDNTSSNENFEAIKDLIEKHKELVIYRKNKERLGVEKNYCRLLEEANYEYVKFLADDDFLHSEALELMEKALDHHENICLVSSRRIPVNEENEFIKGVKATEPLCEKDQVLSGKEVIKKSLVDLRNYVGEFSTYMFRKSCLDINPFKFCGLNFRANADWVLWMYLLSKGDIFYFSRPLSLFMIHAGQDQGKLDVRISGLKECMEFVFNKRIHHSFNIHLTLEEKAKAVENIASAIFWSGFEISNFPRKELAEILLERYQREIREKVEKRDCNRFSFSVIVVTYNSSSTIEKLLKSLKVSVGEDDEVIIVDNASQDETISVVENFIDREKVENFKILKLKENIGYAAAINEGVKLSKNKYLAFVNPDTVLPLNWTEVVYKNLNDKTVGAVGAISNYVFHYQHILKFSSLGTILKEDNFLNYLNLLNKHLSNFYGFSGEEKKVLIGFFLATKKEVFEKVGGFDEDLFIGMDDLDYSLKLREHGFKLILPKNLFVYHKGHVSFEKSEGSERLKEQTENVFAEKLIDKYGFGNVPTPEELWADDGEVYFGIFTPNSTKYKFMFKFSDKKTDFKQTAKEILRKPKVGIVTVSYFSNEDINILANSLSKSSYENFHWYIIDHSEDKGEIKRLKQAISVIPEEKVTIVGRENLGYAAGVNFGAKLALSDGCEYIWILNPDIEVESNTLSELLRTILFTGVPAVTCIIRDFFEREKLQYDGFTISHTLFSDYFRRIHKVLFLSGGNIFLKADIFRKIKFEESYFLYFEDNDFQDKLSDIGIEPICTPYASIYHKNKTVEFLGSPLKVYYFFRNQILFLKKKKEYSVVFYELKKAYSKLFSKKRGLHALISAIYDGVFDITGKKEMIFTYKGKDKAELLENYVKLRKVSKVLSLEKGKEYLLANPRDADIFLKYLSDAICIMFYMEGRDGRKS